jgi:predicted amidophosphoribosyltransferase
LHSTSDPRLDQVPGFGLCGKCPYNTSGPADLCYACARRTIEALAPPDQRCQVCDLPFNPGETWCENVLCKKDDRWFERNFAVAMRSGQLEAAINRYKYGGATGWAFIFGRVVAGFLEEWPETFRSFDLIVASPTYVGEGGRTFDHTRLVLERAAAEMAPSSDWPFDITGAPAIVKTAATASMVGKGFKARRDVAETEIRAALVVPDPDRTTGKRILVYDDVFTDGLTLNEVARALQLQGGAEAVCGVTLCRQPWKGKPMPLAPIPF